MRYQGLSEEYAGFEEGCDESTRTHKTFGSDQRIETAGDEIQNVFRTYRIRSTQSHVSAMTAGLQPSALVVIIEPQRS